MTQDTPVMRAKELYRAIFVSDLHLGSSKARRKEVREFLSKIDAEYLYLVGDIVDVWNLNSWNDETTLLVRQILSFVKRGRKVVYIYGNHDATAKHLGAEQAVVHTTLKGKRYLVTHGDMFDPPWQRWLYRLGAWLYSLAPRHLPTFAKRKIKTIKLYNADFVRQALKAATNYDGVICGHLHIPEICENYYNTGDWTDNKTAILELCSGDLVLVDNRV